MDPYTGAAAVILSVAALTFALGYLVRGTPQPLREARRYRVAVARLRFDAAEWVETHAPAEVGQP